MNKKQQIVKWLKEFKRCSTSKIIGLIGANHQYAMKYLTELEKEGLIVMEEETNATFWRIK